MRMLSVCLSLSHQNFSCLATPSVPSLVALCRPAIIIIIIIIIMNFNCVCSLLLALAVVATAGPFGRAGTSVAADAALRLIKVSESDPGTWVREDEKIENYVAKGVNFVDITGMSVGEPGCRCGLCCAFGMRQGLTLGIWMARNSKWRRRSHALLRWTPQQSHIPLHSAIRQRPMRLYQKFRPPARRPS